MTDHVANNHCHVHCPGAIASGIGEQLIRRLRLLLAFMRQAQINHRQKVLSKRTPLSAVDCRLLRDIGVSQAQVLATSLDA